MTRTMESRTAVFALVTLSAPAMGAAQSTLTLDAGAFNAYVWRGVTLTNRFVIQPDGYVTLPVGDGRGSFVLGGWTTIEAGQYDDPLHDLSEGGGQSSFDATEIDLWAEYGQPLGSGLTGTLGGLLYLYPNDAGLTNDANRTFEVYGKIQAASLPLAPKVALWYDLGKVDGAYVEAGVSRAVEFISGFPVTFGAVAGASLGQDINADEPDEVANFADDGLTHVDLSATGALGVGPVTLAPTVHLVMLHDDFTKTTEPGVRHDVKAWAGVTLTWSKAFGAPLVAE